MNFKRGFFAGVIAALLALTSIAHAAGVATGAITTQNLVAAGTCTAGGCVELEITDKGIAAIQVTGTYTGALSGQITIDGSTWITLAGSGTFTRMSTAATSATITSGQTDVYQVGAVAGAKKFRIAALAAVTGTANITIQSVLLSPGSSTTVSGGAGDASAANQVTGNASLASIDGKTPALGQAVAGSSVPVVLPAAQITTLTPPAAITGFATAAKQPALGTAGSSSTDVISVQGIASGTALPISAASLPLPSTAATSTKQSDGTQKTQVVDGSGNVIGATSNALDVNIKSGASSGAVAQGSTTSGQTGGLTQAAVTTTPPTYTTAQTDPLSMTTAGGLRIDINSIAGTTISSGNGASGSGTLRVSLANDSTGIGTVTETAPASDTASSGLNGRLQRIAQNLTVLHTDVTSTNTQLPTTPAAAGQSATGSAVPTGATLAGARSGANLVAIIQGDTTAKIDVSTATTTQLVALSGSTKVYVTSLSIIAAGTGNIKFVYGTGSSCGTGTTDLTANYNLTAQSGLALGAGLGPVLVVPASQALCVTTSAAVQMSGHVTYTQF